MMRKVRHGVYRACSAVLGERRWNMSLAKVGERDAYQVKVTVFDEQEVVVEIPAYSLLRDELGPEAAAFILTAAELNRQVK